LDRESAFLIEHLGHRNNVQYRRNSYKYLLAIP
jgi:hypothetical protein